MGSTLEVETILAQNHNIVQVNNNNSSNSNNINVACEPAAENEGVYLTWENLWVNISDGKSGTRSILQGLTGYARPGEILAIMGPSGSGKTTLLDALAGRLDSNTRQSGEILINGRKQDLAYGTSAYVTQDDTLITTLTVREAVYCSAQLQLPNSMSQAEKKERANTTIREMGLQDCIDMRIGGGWGAKGLSGGQKRRVSICIEILTHPKLLFLDEPTSGLDSAASYYVMSMIARLDNREGRTILASIHQPCSEVFALFHNLCLLSGGRTLYFGPCSFANEFFSTNGFPCPIMQNPSDHYLRTINNDFDEDIEDGRKPVEEVIHILIDSYKSSHTYQQLLTQLSQISKKGSVGLEKKRRHASFVTQCVVLTKRSFVNMNRDLGYYWLRLAIHLILAVGLGTLFYHLGSTYNSIEPKGAMLMFSASYLTFMAIGGFPSFVEDMKVFGRERLNGHYGAGAFVIANTFSSLPYLLLISFIPGAISYYITGLQNDFQHFAYYSLVLFTCMMLVEGLMMIVASIVPNFLMGIIIGAGIQGFMMLGGGFFRKPHRMPKEFWTYPVYNIAFHKYAFQGLYKNEFEGMVYRVRQAGKPHVITGEYILRNTFQVEMGYSKWVDLCILLGMMVLYRALFLVIVKSNEKFRPAMKAFVASISPRKQIKQQVMVNPTSTPLHQATI